jgi:hypothetical protein
LGAQQMVDILTNKNLSLEDQVRDLQETVNDLVSLFLLSFLLIFLLLFFSKESLCDMYKGKRKSIYLKSYLFLKIEMEEHAKEVEHDLRENIDLIQNQLREV